ncbi:MAG: ATP-binding cassette domain-containing protein [Eubacteriales bacterium]
MFVGLLSAFQSYQSVLLELFFTFSEFGVIRQNLKDIANLDFSLAEEDAPDDAAESLEIKESIEFKNVSFRYPGKDRDALSGINCKIDAGETVFIVGMNGSGKSIFIKLLTGLYTPTGGEVLYDGAAVGDARDIYHNFAVLFQDFAKYPFDIRGNVDICGENDETKLQYALKSAGVDYVGELPAGIDTKLGTVAVGGVNISEGQWQRLAFARAVYRGSRFYIFDEPTSALDPLAEERMYELYSELPDGSTKIIISHRLGFARKADRIIVFDGGEIKEQGGFDELIAEKGLFYEMFTLQQGLYAAEGGGDSG